MEIPASSSKGALYTPVKPIQPKPNLETLIKEKEESVFGQNKPSKKKKISNGFVGEIKMKPLGLEFRALLLGS